LAYIIRGCTLAKWSELPVKHRLTWSSPTWLEESPPLQLLQVYLHHLTQPITRDMAAQFGALSRQYITRDPKRGRAYAMICSRPRLPRLLIPSPKSIVKLDGGHGSATDFTFHTPCFSGTCACPRNGRHFYKSLGIITV